MTFSHLPIACVFLAALATSALAQQPAGQKFLEMLDTDGSGTVSRAEFAAASMAMFAQSDADRDGFVSRNEFLEIGRPSSVPEPEARYRRRVERFDGMDTDGDGRLSAAELEAIQAARFSTADTNADGQLTVNEIGGGQ